ncbi:RGS-like protein [Mya arenaria]|uniref:RGS-like protein n=1 Tax=Mya arenaria TaxID=6604 RepID=A0ABY7FLK7_MYAAR|nr:RGS-like protein [Mya arenaria]
MSLSKLKGLSWIRLSSTVNKLANDKRVSPAGDLSLSHSIADIEKLFQGVYKEQSEWHLERDQERKGVTPLGSPEEGSGVVKERWSGVFQNGLSPGKYRSKNHRNPLSLSHEVAIWLVLWGWVFEDGRAGTMFLDISFIGAASYRKDGYSKIYKKLQKQKRRSECLQEAIPENGDILDINQNCLDNAMMNMSLPHFSEELWEKSAQAKKDHKNIKSIRRKSGLTVQQLYDNRLYEKYCAKNYASTKLNQSLVVLDQDSTPNKLSSASSVNSIVSHVATATEREEVGRVTSWAVNFDKLLRDRVGIAVFKEFLKKEFSEENIEFWQTCEDYRNIADPKLRKAKAREVYDKHVAMHSSDPVNIDSALRKGVEAELTVDNPPPTIFLQAQQHIYQLMKQDSYVRFLKSEVYRSYMMAEMEGQALKMPGATSTDPRQVLATGNTEAGKKKGKNGKDGTEENKERRRRSLLPWRQKSKKQGNKNEKNENDAKNLKPSKDNKDNNMNDLPLKCNAPTTIDTVASKRDLAQIAVS